MTEAGTLAALVACAILTCAADLAGYWHRMADEAECALERTSICIISESKEN